MATFRATGVTRAFIGLVGVGGVVGALYLAQRYLIPGGIESFIPEKGDLAEFKEGDAAPTSSSATVQAPSLNPATVEGPQTRLLVIPWNAQMGLLFSVGGTQTMQGSLMEKYGVNLRVERQDDYGRMKEALVACANELSSGASDCNNGAHLVTIMGDGAPYFLASLNGMLSKLGPDYQAEVIGGFGRSFGEDKFMGPPECLKDPNACRGTRIAGFLLDGDWNIAMFWAAQNTICNNPDVKTYDPECLNWYGTSSFGEADEAYIKGSCETLPVVSKGKRTGSSEEVCISGVVTWTPGDVAVTQQKGGLASILSTRETGSQMPNVVIGIKKWDKDHKDILVNLLRAGYEGGAAVRSDSSALLSAGEASAQVYKEGDAAYWVRYYKGTEELDKTGKVMVPLGGSRVFTYADAARFFGLESGAMDAFHATYTYFGNLGIQAYPEEMPGYPPHSQIFNPEYLKEVGAEKTLVAGTVEAPDFTASSATSQVVARRNWNIQFRTNSADFTPETQEVLEELGQALTIAGETVVEIHGHTDSVGNPDYNQQLSEDRAFAVKNWLESRGAKTFPSARVKTFAHGQNEPVASNKTKDGQSQNRRVEIVLRSL